MVNARSLSRVLNVIVLGRMQRMAENLGLESRMKVSQAGVLYSSQAVVSGIPVRVIGRNVDKVGFDRGGLVNVGNRPVRTSPCFAPFIDLDIDWRGDFLLCCNIYSDDERHKGYMTGNLHDGRSIFDHYADDLMVEWRKRLFRFHPDFLPCRSCSRKEFPNLATDANAAELDGLFRKLCGTRIPAVLRDGLKMRWHKKSVGLDSGQP